jgi:hypothetical protein
VQKAQAELVRPNNGETTVTLKVQEIATRTELFQPRGFFHQLFEIDNAHVTKLEREIRIKGELDPVIVVKLGETWTCIDGHHRLAAYEKNRWTQPITCVWFGGSIKEAVDESIRRNAIVKLEVPQPDRLEEAWRRVVLGWGSKADIVKLCGVGDGTVAKMRRAKELYKLRGDIGAKLFRERLGQRLEETRWSAVLAAYHDLPERLFDEKEKAAKLARQLRARMDDKLSRDPVITARAIALYDAELPDKLWQRLRYPPDEKEDEDD